MQFNFPLPPHFQNIQNLQAHMSSLHDPRNNNSWMQMPSPVHPLSTSWVGDNNLRDSFLTESPFQSNSAIFMRDHNPFSSNISQLEFPVMENGSDIQSGMMPRMMKKSSSMDQIQKRNGSFEKPSSMNQERANQYLNEQLFNNIVNPTIKSNIQNPESSQIPNHFLPPLPKRQQQSRIREPLQPERHNMHQEQMYRQELEQQRQNQILKEQEAYRQRILREQYNSPNQAYIPTNPNNSFTNYPMNNGANQQNIFNNPFQGQEPNKRGIGEKHARSILTPGKHSSKSLPRSKSNKRVKFAEER